MHFLFERYTCDVADGRCNKGDLSIPFYKKIESKKLNKNVDEVCPGLGLFLTYLIIYSI
jgi:hypothetical protein